MQHSAKLSTATAAAGAAAAVAVAGAASSLCASGINDDGNRYVDSSPAPLL